MATYLFQARLQGQTNIPSDVYENVLFFDVNAPDTVQGRCENIRDLYVGSNLFGGINGVEVRAYNLGGGQPIASSKAAKPVLGVGWPREVACCLSYAAVDDPDQSIARRRGRIYLGPIGNAHGAADRPDALLRTTVLDFGSSLANIGFGANTTWMLFSRTDQVAAKIESIWVDDAWDTQRRRGLDPTARQVRDVQ